MFFCSIKRKLLSILLVFLVIIVFIRGNMITNGHPVTSWEEYNYSFFEIQRLKESARNGDNDAAYKLGMFYYLIKKNDEVSMKWLKLAADGNHIEAIKELIRYESLFDTKESRQSVSEYIQKLKEIAVAEMKDENFYIADLKID